MVRDYTKIKAWWYIGDLKEKTLFLAGTGSGSGIKRVSRS
jgi:hypothetical protein